jgi:two-component system, OmpR family, phosphate regulon sensor histidine kinase PhoR
VGTGLPWTIAVAYDPTNSLAATRSPLVLILLTVMFAFLAAGTYFIARAIRREMEIARLQSDFVAAVSHEFRSPLTTIRSLSEMLHAGRTIDQNVPQYYQTLVSESSRLQRLVETLLNFGRMESGQRRLRFEELDAAELVRDVVSGFAASGRAIEVHVGSPVRLHGDREAVGVAVRNLIENAIHYSQAPEPVEITVAHQDGQVTIAVKDHGRGVQRDERDEIFKKFVRGSAAAAGNVRGTGVGLAVVRQIAEAHRGKIHLESSLRKGSVFTLAIPLEQNS